MRHTALELAEAKRAEFAQKVKQAEAQVRYAEKALATAKARLEAAEEIVAAMRRNQV